MYYQEGPPTMAQRNADVKPGFVNGLMGVLAGISWSDGEPKSPAEPPAPGLVLIRARASETSLPSALPCEGGLKIIVMSPIVGMHTGDESGSATSSKKAQPRRGAPVEARIRHFGLQSPRPRA